MNELEKRGLGTCGGRSGPSDERKSVVTAFLELP